MRPSGTTDSSQDPCALALSSNMMLTICPIMQADSLVLIMAKSLMW